MMLGGGGTRDAIEDESMEENTSGMLVAVRLRPLTDNERRLGHRESCRVVGDQAVVIEKFGAPNGHLKSQQSSCKEYAYDIAFPETASQDEVYTKTVKDIIPTILNGYHATVFAYGATGAGKTHTMMGSERDGLGEMEDSDEEIDVDGIIPHALTDIFSLIKHRKLEEDIIKLSEGSSYEWKVLVSYLEVYNEQIRDLLAPTSRTLALREDQAQGIVHVAGLHHEEAHSARQVLQLLRRGNRHRKTESTAANTVSSRSHAVIQVIVRHTTTIMLSETNPRKSIVEGKLSLIDLAGSERASTTKNRGMRLTEGANINKNSLEGDCRLVMIANINPSHASFDESHNTLKYANRAKNIKIRPKMHVITAEMTYQQRIDKLEKENIQLRKALTDTQAEIEQLATMPKRKSMEIEISPNTIKKFKNFPLGEPTKIDYEPSIPPMSQNNEELEALRATIRRLEADNVQLKSVVVDLKSANKELQAKMHKADTLLKCLASDVVVQSIDTPVLPPPPPPPVSLPAYNFTAKGTMIPRFNRTYSKELDPRLDQENQPSRLNAPTNGSWQRYHRSRSYQENAEPTESKQQQPKSSFLSNLRRPSSYHHHKRRPGSNRL